MSLQAGLLRRGEFGVSRASFLHGAHLLLLLQQFVCNDFEGFADDHRCFFFCVTCIGKRIPGAYFFIESALAPYSRSIALLFFCEVFRRSPRFCFVFVEVYKIYQATFAGVPAVLFG